MILKCPHQEKADNRRMSVSILILTLNEEINLPACLASVAWADDVVVLDSFSTDRTVEIAREYGARVVQREFDNYAAHREWARLNIEFRHPWVFGLDADERCTPELAAELQEVTHTASDDVALYLVRGRYYFMGKWIKYSSLYPIWFERLYRPLRIHLRDRIVNEHMEADGEVRHLQEFFIHYPFNKGISFWLERHNRYSSMEAMEYLKEQRRRKVNWKGLLHSNSTTRRLTLKNIACRFPFRPMLKFLYMYFICRGFLDGAPGFTYCMMQSIYEYMIDLKVQELRRREEQLPV